MADDAPAFTLQELNSLNVDFKKHVQWVQELYVLAVTEELSYSPAGAHRRLDPSRSRELAHALESLISDSNRCCLLMAFEGSLPIGYFLGVIKDCVGEDPSRMGYINGLYVLPAARRKKVAQSLLDAGVRWFKSRNLPLVELYVSIQNRAAQGFWRKNGYLPSEEVMFKKI